MLLLKKWWIYLIFLTAVIIVLLLAIDSYLVFSVLNIQNDLTIKFYLENVIFYAVLGVLLLTILLVVTIVNSRSIFRELDKIAEISRQGTQPVHIHLKRLGALGAKISEINHNLDVFNIKKSLKISALTNLSNFLIDNLGLSVIILDGEGRVDKISPKFAEEMHLADKDFKDTFIEDIFNEIDTRTLINNLRHSKSVAVRTQLKPIAGANTEEIVLIFYPLTNSQNELTYCVGLRRNSHNNRNNNETNQ